MSDFLARLAERATGSIAGERLLPAAPFRFAPGEPGFASSPSSAAEPLDASSEAWDDAPSSRSIATPGQPDRIDFAPSPSPIQHEASPAVASRVHPATPAVHPQHPSAQHTRSGHAEESIDRVNQRHDDVQLSADARDARSPATGPGMDRTADGTAGPRVRPADTTAPSINLAADSVRTQSADAPAEGQRTRSADALGEPSSARGNDRARDTDASAVARSETRPVAAPEPASTSQRIDARERVEASSDALPRSPATHAAPGQALRPRDADPEARNGADTVALKPAAPVATSLPGQASAPRLRAVPTSPPARPRLEPIARAEPPVVRSTTGPAGEAEAPAPAAAPVIHVSIGRVEVRAVSSSAPAPRTRSAGSAPAVSLDDYLRARDGGRR